MTDNSILVSVLIPYYNDEKFLHDSIDSVLNQNYKNFELVLLNHASTDNSRNIAHSYKDNRIIHIDMSKNYGAGGGILIREFLKVANGKYLKFFCADDIMYENCLYDIINFMENNKEIDFSFSNVEYIDENGKSLHDNWFKSRENFSINDDEISCLKKYISNMSFLPYIGSFVKRDAMKNVDLDLSMIMLFDMSIWIMLLLNGKKIGFINKIVAGYRIHQGQLSAIKNEKKSGVMCYYESPAYRNIFATCKSLKIAKSIYSESKYIELLNDERDIPFIAYEYLFSRYKEPAIALKIHDMLQNDKYRGHLIETFNYDIDVYREEYSKVEQPNEYHGVKKYKNKIYSKRVKELNFFDLIYLMIRNIYNIITLKSLLKRNHKKKSL